MSKPTTLSATELDQFIKEHDFAVIECWSPTCPPCLRLAPVIDELASKHASVAFAKVNISDFGNIELTAKFDINTIPAILVFKKGRLKEHLIGYRDAEQLEEELGLK